MVFKFHYNRKLSFFCEINPIMNKQFPKNLFNFDFESLAA